jgi:electron transport complex protein RnfG
MNKRLKMILVMTLFACISGGVLSFVYMLSNPFIEANMLDELRKAIFVVVPSAEEYEQRVVDEVVYFECKDGSGATVGIALPAQGNGYQGVIKLMVGLTPDLSRITGIKVLEQVETPGLGGRISEEGFQSQFQDISAQPGVEYVKNQEPDKDNQIKAVTGATISSRSVVAIINKNIQKLSDTMQ